MAKKIRIQAELDDSKLRKQLDDIGKRKEKIMVDVDSGNIGNADQSMKRLNRTVSDSNSVFGRLKSTISNTFSSGKIVLTGYLMVLNEINKAGKNAKQTIQEIDKAVTDLSVATNMSRESVTGLIKDYNTYAKQLSSTTTQITSAADDYLRAGKSMSETQALIKDSIMLSKLGQLGSGEATEDLLAVMNGYEMSIDEVSRALDVMVALDMEAATSSSDIATALKYCASSADVAGLSFDKLAAMIAITQEKTMQSAETIGTFMNTILSRYRNVKIGQFVDDDGEDLSEVETILNSLDIKLRNSEQEFRDFETVIEEVAQSWDNYSSVQQAAIAKAFSGTRQQNRFLALMEGYNKTLELTEVAANSAGTAVEKFNNSYMESLEAKQNALQASFESMIMNTDFSEVYSGILDATTALVEFIDKTNTLKGVVSGIAVTGMVKAFLAVKTGIGEAYIALNKYGNALNIVKQTKISTQDFERLLLLTNSLSANQMKLILTSKNLTAEQKMQIVTNAVLSEEEKALMIQTYGLTAANTGLTAATTTLGNSLKALFATLVANPLIVVTAAVSAAVMAYQTYNQKLEETRRANIDNATAASEHADELRKQYDEYMRLASIQDKTTSQEEEFKTAVDSIISSLGSKADALKELTAGTEEYTDALARATKEELQSQAVSATVGRKSAEEEFQGSFWDDWKGSKVSVDSNDKGKSLSDEAQKAVNIVRDSLKEYETINRTWKNISWDISSDDPTEALEYYNSLVEAREKLVLASEDDESLLDTEIYKDLNTAINSMSESLDTYIEKLYEEEKLNYMAQNGIPTTTEEYSAMEEAITGAAGSSETLQNRFQDLLMTDFAPLINEVEEVEKTVDSVASGMADPSLSISQTIDQLNTQLKPAFDSLKSAYQDIFTDDGFTLENVDTSMLSSIKSAIDELNKMEDVDINVDYSSFENLAKVLTDSSSTAEDVKAAFNSLATEIVNSTSATAGMTDETRNMVVQLLESLGVTNAEEVAMYALSEAKAEAFLASYDLANATQDEITAMLAEAEAAGIATDMIFKLVAEEQIFNNQGLSVEGKVQELKKLAEAYGQTAVAAKIARMEDEYKKSHQPINYEEIAKAAQAEINNAVNSVHVDFSGIGKGAKSAGSKAGKDYKDGLKEQLSDLDSVISGITSRIDDNIESVRTQKEEAVAAIDAQIDALNEQKSALEDQKKALEEERDARIEVIEQQKKQLELAIKAIDKQIKQKEKVIQGIQDEIKAMQDANAEKQRQIDLQQALYDLERLQHQRTILQYSEDLGMHYVANTKDIRSQKDKVDDAKLEIEIAKKQQQIDLIEKEIDLLNEKKEAINEQIEILDEQKDQIDEFYDKQIKAIDKQIEAIDKQIEKLQKQKEETEKYYESLIENMEKSKSKYEELTELVGKAELSAKLKQLGIDEEALVNGSEEEFQKLKNAYLDVVFQLNSGNKDVLAALQELSGYNGTAPAMLDDSNTKLGTMNDELGNTNKEVGNVNSSLGETATTTGNVATNVSDVNTNIGETTGLVNEEKGAFDELKVV